MKYFIALATLLLSQSVYAAPVATASDSWKSIFANKEVQAVPPGVRLYHPYGSEVVSAFQVCLRGNVVVLKAGAMDICTAKHTAKSMNMLCAKRAVVYPTAPVAFTESHCVERARFPKGTSACAQTQTFLTDYTQATPVKVVRLGGSKLDRLSPPALFTKAYAIPACAN